MKKKSIALLATMALVASMTACGGKTEEAAGSNVNEPTVESTVQESQVAESTTQEVTEATEASSEAPASEEAPAVAEMTYEVSELIMPDGSAIEPVDSTLWLERMGNDTSISYPYYTVTNTSNSAYSIDFGSIQYKDNNFEAGESIILPALPNANDDGTYFEWLNINKFVEIGMTSVNTGDVNSIANVGNRVQEKTTITFDESKVNTGGYSQLDNIDFTVSGNNFSNNYIIFYDEAGNVIATWATGFNGNYGIVTNGTATNFIYPMFSDYSTNEPFTWASADVYYSYEIAQ